MRAAWKIAIISFHHDRIALRNVKNKFNPDSATSSYHYYQFLRVLQQNVQRSSAGNFGNDQVIQTPLSLGSPTQTPRGLCRLVASMAVLGVASCCPHVTPREDVAMQAQHPRSNDLKGCMHPHRAAPPLRHLQACGEDSHIYR